MMQIMTHLSNNCECARHQVPIPAPNTKDSEQSPLDGVNGQCSPPSWQLALYMTLILFIFTLQRLLLSESYVIWNDPLNDTNGKYITWTESWHLSWYPEEPGYSVLYTHTDDCPTLNVCWEFAGNYFAYYIHPTLSYTNISLTLSVSAWGLETGTITDDFCGVYYSIDSTQNWVNIATWNDDDPIPITKTFMLPSETADNVGIGIKIQSKDNAGNANDYCWWNDVILSGERMYTNENTETVIGISTDSPIKDPTETPIIASSTIFSESTSESSTLNVIATTETYIETRDSTNKEYITSTENGVIASSASEQASTLDSVTETKDTKIQTESDVVNTMSDTIYFEGNNGNKMFVFSLNVGVMTVIVLTCICIIVSCIYIYYLRLEKQKKMHQVNDMIHMPTKDDIADNIQVEENEKETGDVIRIYSMNDNDVQSTKGNIIDNNYDIENEGGEAINNNPEETVMTAEGETMNTKVLNDGIGADEFIIHGNDETTQ